MHPRTPLAAGLDTAVVVTFVAIGRRNHDEDTAVAGLLGTLAPFFIALVISWVVWRVWNNPTNLLSGVQVWATTAIVGMLLRRFAFDDGTATPFIVVATVFLATFLVGWRAVYDVVDQRRAARVN